MEITLPAVLTTVALIGLFSLLGGIALFAYHILEREKRFKEREKIILSEYQDIIKTAHNQASELLEKTTAASEKIINQVQTTNVDMSKNLDKVLQAMADKQIKSLETEADAFKKEYQDKIGQMEKAVDQKINQNLETFSSSITDKASTSAHLIDEKTKELMLKNEKELEEYKKAEIAKIDSRVEQFVQKTAQEALGVNLPPEIQKEIVIKALEKAKAEGVFDV